jgi:selenocysteine lyase/cysteine desulfurase
MYNRRDFLQRGAVAAAVFGIPLRLAEQSFGQDAPRLPDDKLFANDQERYWSELRRQWLLAPDRINLNCGALGCTPLPVLRATIDHMLYAESYREPEYPWFGYEETSRLRDLRDTLSTFLNCRRDELALTRNTTEGNNVVCNGLDMKAGEEALLTDQEHVGGRCPWEQKAARHGVRLNFVTLPRPPASVDDIVSRFDKAITPNTRIIVFSHITTTTGLVLPVKEICQLARKRGILTHVDGAHAIGQIPLDLHDLGCDFYASSPHKWLCAPKGSGILYVREEQLERLWVNIATRNWRDFNLKAYRFSFFGTDNLSGMVGFKAALDFFNAIGTKRIYQRLHELAGRVRKRVQGYPQLRLANASADQFYGGLVSFEAVKGDLKRVAQECAARNIRTGGDRNRLIRISTHIFTQQPELNSFFDALDRGLRN